MAKKSTSKASSAVSLSNAMSPAFRPLLWASAAQRSLSYAPPLGLLSGLDPIAVDEPHVPALSSVPDPVCVATAAGRLSAQAVAVRACCCLPSLGIPGRHLVVCLAAVLARPGGTHQRFLPMHARPCSGARTLSAESVCVRVVTGAMDRGTVLTGRAFPVGPCLGPVRQRLASAPAPCCWCHCVAEAWGRGGMPRKEPVPSGAWTSARVPIQMQLQCRLPGFRDVVRGVFADDRPLDLVCANWGCGNCLRLRPMFSAALSFWADRCCRCRWLWRLPGRYALMAALLLLATPNFVPGWGAVALAFLPWVEWPPQSDHGLRRASMLRTRRWAGDRLGAFRECGRFGPAAWVWGCWPRLAGRPTPLPMQLGWLWVAVLFSLSAPRITRCSTGSLASCDAPGIKPAPLTDRWNGLALEILSTF